MGVLYEKSSFASKRRKFEFGHLFNFAYGFISFGFDYSTYKIIHIEKIELLIARTLAKISVEIQYESKI